MITWLAVGLIFGVIIGMWFVHYLDEKDREEVLDLVDEALARIPIVTDKDILGAAIEIGSDFEEFLTNNDIRIPNKMREGNPDEAAIFGDDWNYIVQRNEFRIRQLLWSSHCVTENGFEDWKERNGVTEDYD